MEERVMGLSRRQFTREFKLAAVKRLEDGVSLGEVARALALLWSAAHHQRTAGSRLEGEPEASSPADARGQLVVRTPAEVRDHDRFRARFPSLSEPGAEGRADRRRPALAG